MLNNRIFTFIINHKGNDYITHDVNLDVIPKDFIMSEFLNILARYKLDFDVIENNDKCFKININETINQDAINDLNEVFNQQTGELTMENLNKNTTADVITEKDVGDVVFNAIVNGLNNETDERKLFTVFSLVPTNRHTVKITHKEVDKLLKEIEPYYSEYGISLNNIYQEEYENNIAEINIIEIYFNNRYNIGENTKSTITDEIKTMLDNIIYVNDQNCNGINIKRGIRLIPKPVETKWELNKSYNYSDTEPKGFYVDSTTRIQLSFINRTLEIYTGYFIL